MWGGKQVRACYGTTKYCHSYLRKAACSNPECSYLHEPAPEEDTVTKDEMNPITGRKDILHLVHPGGTPRSRTKKAPVKPTSQCIGEPPAAAAAVEPDVPEPSPSKDSPAWAIAAPSGADAIGTGMLEAVRDSSSLEDSPQFVIAANAAPNAWPALSEVAAGTDTLCDRTSLCGSSRRPSTKDVVTGTAFATETAVKEPAQTGARMLPLAAPGRSRFGSRGVVVNGSAPLLSASSHELQEDEHALSTMPSTELLGSRVRLDLCADSPGGSPTAPPHSPSAMVPAPADCTSVFSAPPMASQGMGDFHGGHHMMPPPPAHRTHHLHVNTTAFAHRAADTGDQTGERVLSALDLLPASLEDALDGRASLPTTAQVEEGHSPHKAASYPATPAPPGASSTLPGVVQPSARKQSRFAFVHHEGAMCTAGGTSFSLPKDLENFTDAPVFRPGSARVANKHAEPGDMSSHAHQNTVWDQSAAAEEHALAAKQFSLPVEATMGAAQQRILQQQQARMNPAAQSGLEQPPMSNESIVQAVTAQIETLFSQSGPAAMMPAAGGLGGAACAGALPAAQWSQMQQKAVPDQGRQEQMHNNPSIQFLHALLQQQAQQQQELAAAGMHEAAAARGMQHLATGSAAQAAARQGLAIKRPPQPPQPMSSMGMNSSASASMYQQRAMQQHAFMQPERSDPHIHGGANSLHPASAGVAHALHQGGVLLGMQRAGRQYGQVPAASMGMVDPSLERARALQHQMAQYGGDGSYLPDAAVGGYGNWDAAHDTYNAAMLNDVQMRVRQMAAPLGNYMHPRGHGWE